MPGRKKPPMTESEKKREYRLMQKRGYGEATRGGPASSIGGGGGAAEIERERERWAREHERGRREGA